MILVSWMKYSHNPYAAFRSYCDFLSSLILQECGFECSIYRFFHRKSSVSRTMLPLNPFSIRFFLIAFRKNTRTDPWGQNDTKKMHNGYLWSFRTSDSREESHHVKGMCYVEVVLKMKSGMWFLPIVEITQGWNSSLHVQTPSKWHPYLSLAFLQSLPAASGFVRAPYLIAFGLLQVRSVF